MSSRRYSAKRIPRSEFMKLSPAQKAAKSRAVNRTKTYKSKTKYTPTYVSGPSVGRTLLTTTPLFPVRKFQKGQLYYEGQLGLSPSIGSIAIYNFSANDLFDPNRTGTGHQPMGFDQMMLMYEQFTVIRSHIKVNFINTSDEASRVAILLNPDTGSTSVTSTMENGLLKSTVISGAVSSGGTQSMKTLELACDIPKYFGKSFNAILADPQMYGTVSSSPAEQVYFQIATWDPFSNGTSASVAFDVTISYDVMYWEPKKLSGS